MLIQLVLAAVTAVALASTNSPTTTTIDGRVVRQYTLDVTLDYAPLALSLPNETAIYREWPPAHLRAELPDYQRIAGVRRMLSDNKDTNNNADNAPTLMGPPVHVRRNEILSVTLINHLQASGLSIHWHGFEMEDSPEYDGVVGVTQCPVSPGGGTFEYRFVVDEEVGTYWYHTHAGALGVDAADVVRGALIVHPEKEFKELEVSVVNVTGSQTVMAEEEEDLVESMNKEGVGKAYRLAYGNERILFFSEGKFVHDAVHEMWMMGGLNAPSTLYVLFVMFGCLKMHTCCVCPDLILLSQFILACSVSRNDDGFGVASQEFKFGTCNGKLREIVPVGT